MEVDDCGRFTHLQPIWSDLVTTLDECNIMVLLTNQVGEVDGGEVSLTNNGRTRDSKSDLIPNRSVIASYAFGGIGEQDTLRDTEDWIYNSQWQE